MPDLSFSPSGLPTVDAQWGGLASGSTTLLVGRAGAGRTALALQSAGATVAAGGRALLLSPRTPEALLEASAAGGFDLRAAHATGRFRVLRIPAAADLAARGADGLDKAYRDLAGLVGKERPDRVVIEDLTPLVQFDTFELFRAAFSGFAGAVRETGASLLVGLGEPANDASQQLLAVAREAADGVVTLTTEGDTPHIALSRLGDVEPASDAAPTTEAPAPMPVAEAPHLETPAEALHAEAPVTEAPAAAAQSSDGASVEVEPPSTPPADEPEAVAAGSGDLPQAQIVPPPDAPDELLAPAGDTFGQDPAESMFDQGYLVDSGASGVVGFVPASAAPVAESPPVAPPAPAPPTPTPPAAAPPAAPAFASLGASAPANPEADVRQALDAAFAARAQGTPFIVVAARMAPTVPEAAHFFAVADGLRRALRTEDRLLVDLPRRRAVVVLPGVGAEGATALFARLQGHLRAELAASAEPVLAAVAAVSIPDGQPFTSAQDLLAYAYES